MTTLRNFTPGRPPAKALPHPRPLSPVRRGIGVAVAATLALGLAACGDDFDGSNRPHRPGDALPAPVTSPAGNSASNDSNTDPDSSTLTVVSTVAPITSIIANVAGPDVTVIGLVPEGVNSHTFEPPPSAAEALAQADVVFINGLGLEDPTEDLAQANVANGVEIVKLGNEILPEEDWRYDFSFPEEGGKPNPHTWTNPPMVKQYAEVVRDKLSALQPDSADTFSANYEAFATSVDVLDEAMATATATIAVEDRKLVTYHDAYAYFADHYDWTVIGAVEPTDFTEPSPRDVADLITQIQDEGVPAIFGSEVFPSPVLQQIADESGATYIDDLRDDDLPGEPGDPDHSWVGLMKFNFITMVEAFGGDASAIEAVDVADVVEDRATYPQ